MRKVNLNHYIKIIIVLLILIIQTMRLEADEITIPLNKNLTLRDCIDIAIRKNPSLQVAIRAPSVYSSQYHQAKSNYYPQVSVSGDYSNNDSITFSDKTRESNSFSSSLSINQLIYDFGKTSTQLKISKLNIEASEIDIRNAIINLVYNTKVSYYEILKDKKDKEIFSETVKEFELHLKQAEGFYKAGTKSKIDVTTAKVNLSNANLSYIKADNTLKIDISKLNSLMGIMNAPTYDLEEDSEVNYNKITFDEAISNAYKYRPDIQSLDIKLNAAEATVNLAKKGYAPILSGFADYGFSNRANNVIDHISFGASINIPLFNGYLTHYKVQEALANLDIIKANREVLKQNIYFEVEQAFINLNNFERTIPVNEEIVKQAKENLDMVLGRYKVGVANYIEVKDAIISYSNAQLSYVQTLYDYKIAFSNLEKTMGIQ